MVSISSHDVFTPPAPYPGSTDLSLFQKLSQNPKSQIANLPARVYDADAWKPPLPGMPLFIMAPDLIKTVLLDQADQFPHGALFERIMKPAWGDGLLLSQGDDWKTQRRAAAQAFRAAGMAAFVPTFVAETEKLTEAWGTKGFERIDLHAQMKRLTFNIIIETMLSGAEQIDRDAFRDTVQAFFADISKLRLSYVFRSDRYHAGRRSVASAHRSDLVAHICRLVQLRRSAPPRGDLIDLLLVARDPDTNTTLSDAQLADNILGFILAGYETTAAALTWTLYLISEHSPTEMKLLNEYRDADGEGVDDLPFTQQVISEALRLYPPAFMLTRVSAKATRLGEHTVKRGQRINIPIWAIHRNSKIWPRPHVFDPNRFATDQPGPAKYTYMPFGAGPRICIGTAFALIEMRSIIATILPKIRFSPAPRSSVWPVTELALVPRNKIIVGLSKR
ncbi:MAG: cytochrome P450 [Pseudomonadota bacterium]